MHRWHAWEAGVLHLHKGPGHSALAAIIRHQLQQLLGLHKIGNRALHPSRQEVCYSPHNHIALV